MGNYTWSRCFGEHSGFRSLRRTCDPDDPEADRGHCTWDPTHGRTRLGYRREAGNAVLSAIVSRWWVSGISAHDRAAG